MGTLARTIHLRHPNTNRVVTFTTGEVPPEWAAELISNPAAWAADETPVPRAAERQGAEGPARGPAGERSGSASETGGDDTPGGSAATPDTHEAAGAARRVEPPAGNASKDAWVQYAVQVHGADRDDVDQLTRDDIRDTYSSG